jgi:hypothetical protein
MVNRFSISSKWVSEVKADAWGTIPTADSSSIDTTLTAWKLFQSQMLKSVVPGKLYSTDIVSTYSLVYTKSSAYAGGVLAPNGDIHFVPYGSVGTVGQKVSAAGVISTYSLVYTGGYVGGVLAPNGDIHFVPYGAKVVGQKVSSTGVVSTYSLVYTTYFGAYSGGVLAPNGDIHFVPDSAKVGQVINTMSAVPFDQSIALSPWLNKF